VNADTSCVQILEAANSRTALANKRSTERFDDE
jgi:hypothetical protein